jgi:hypothetical protein
VRTRVPDSILTFFVSCLLVVTAGCSAKSSGATASQPLEVQVVEVQQKDVPVYREWIGTLQMETARAQITAANAAVQSAKGAVETAQINLGFTRVTSPVDGIPGIAQQQVGALVSPASGVITTVSTLNPIKVYFTASEQEYLDFARRFPTQEQRKAEENKLELELILADGTTYSHKGRFSFADRQGWMSRQARSGWLPCSRIPETVCGPASMAESAPR